MIVNAQNSFEASKQILRVIYAIDHKYSSYRALGYGYTYVYFSIVDCRYSFSSTEYKNASGLIRRYEKIDVEDVLNITATKYTFAQIAIGAILSRKIMSHREFFDMVRSNFNWLE
jgi:hypothetical protein